MFFSLSFLLSHSHTNEQDHFRLPPLNKMAAPSINFKPSFSSSSTRPLTAQLPPIVGVQPPRTPDMRRTAARANRERAHSAKASLFVHSARRDIRRTSMPISGTTRYIVSLSLFKVCLAHVFVCLEHDSLFETRQVPEFNVTT